MRDILSKFGSSVKIMVELKLSTQESRVTFILKW